RDGYHQPRQNDPGLGYNATIKMAQKSALCAATLNSTAASEFFTQDMEDSSPGAPNGQKKVLCPECGHPLTKSKEEFGGGYFCWTKKGGCGRKFTDDEVCKVQSPTSNDTKEQDSAHEEMSFGAAELLEQLKSLSPHVALTTKA